jgi:hypothetical protein
LTHVKWLWGSSAQLVFLGWGDFRKCRHGNVFLGQVRAADFSLARERLFFPLPLSFIELFFPKWRGLSRKIVVFEGLFPDFPCFHDGNKSLAGIFRAC